MLIQSRFFPLALFKLPSFVILSVRLLLTFFCNTIFQSFLISAVSVLHIQIKQHRGPFLVLCLFASKAISAKQSILPVYPCILIPRDKYSFNSFTASSMHKLNISDNNVHSCLKFALLTSCLAINSSLYNFS